MGAPGDVPTSTNIQHERGSWQALGVGNGSCGIILPGVSNTGKGIVPRQERCKHAKDSAGFLQVNAHDGGLIVGGEIGAHEHEEGDVKGEEEQEEHDGRPESAE